MFTERPIFPRPSKASPIERDVERDGLSDPHGPQRGGLARLHGLRVTDVLPWGTGGSGGTAISGVANVAHVTGGGGAVANCGLVRLNEAIRKNARMMLMNTDQWDMFCV